MDSAIGWGAGETERGGGESQQKQKTILLKTGMVTLVHLDKMENNA